MAAIYDAMIFDMDGVLCDSEAFICEAAMRMFREVHGVTVAAEDFVPFVGTGEDRYLGGVADVHGVQLDMPADKVTTYRIYLEIIRDRLPPLPGVLELVAELRTAGRLIAVASSADLMKVEGNLAAIGLEAPAFDAVVTGSDIEHKKPDPEIFLAASERIGVSPQRCMVAEDAVNGVQGAIAAGCGCVGITTSFEPARLAEVGAGWTAPDLGSLPSDCRAALGLE